MSKRISHRGDVNHPNFPHGEFRGHRAGCRCDYCVYAYREYKKEAQRRYRATNPKYYEIDNLSKRNLRQTPEGKAKYRHDKAKRRTLEKSYSASGSSKLIKLIYLNCPAGYVVDHIMPLAKGGLHHEDNLQYLPAKVNLQKHDKIDFDCSDTAVPWKSILQTSND